MAERGQIGKTKPLGRRLPWPSYYVDRLQHDISVPAFRQDGTLSGVVQDSGSPVVGALVSVVYRPGCRVIATTRTNASGAWSIGGLNPDRPELYAVWIQDPVGGTEYNDAIFASITPST